MNDEILTAEEAAKLLKCTPVYLKSQSAAGNYPGLMVAGEWRYVKSQLIEWLRTKAQAEQIKRQAAHQGVERAKQDGTYTPKRGRRSKVDTAKLNEKYKDFQLN